MSVTSVTSSFTPPKRVAIDGYNPVIQCRPTEHQLVFLRESSNGPTIIHNNPESTSEADFLLDSDAESDSEGDNDSSDNESENTKTSFTNLVVRNFTETGATTMSGIVIDRVEPWEYIAAQACGSNSFVYAIDGRWDGVATLFHSVATGANYSRKRLVWVTPPASGITCTCTEPSFEYLTQPKGRIIGMDFVNGNLFVYIWNKPTGELQFYCRSEFNGMTCPIRIQKVSNVWSKPIVKSIDGEFKFIIAWDRVKVTEIANPLWAFWRPTHEETKVVEVRVYSFTSGEITGYLTLDCFGVQGIARMSTVGHNYAIAAVRHNGYVAAVAAISMIRYSSGNSYNNLEMVKSIDVEIPEGSDVAIHPLTTTSSGGFVLTTLNTFLFDLKGSFQVRVFNHLGYETMDPISFDDIVEASMAGNYLCYGTKTDKTNLYITKLNLNPNDYTV